MALDFRDGSFRVTGCENGHVIFEIVGEDGLVKFVCTMSVSEASLLADDLVSVAHDVSLRLRQAAWREASSKRLS